MKINELKINIMAIFSAACMLMIVGSCDIATEPEIEGPTQVEAKQNIGPTNILARVDDLGKDGKPIYDVSEVQPNPPGGSHGWNNYLATNLSYPAGAKNMGIEGTVIAVFVINSDGSISDVDILRGIGGGCDEEALRVIKNSQNWTPAMQDGQVVNSRMRVPIRFKLS